MNECKLINYVYCFINFLQKYKKYTLGILDIETLKTLRAKSLTLDIKHL